MSEPQKITACASYVYEGTRVSCWGDEISADCEEILDEKEGEICSQPKDSYEEAVQSLNERLLGLAKVLKAFQERAGSRTTKVCANVAWETKGRLTTTGGGEIREEILPLIYRKRKKICGEARAPEEANKKWEEAAAQYAKSYPYREYRDPRFQKIAGEAQKNWRERIPSHSFGTKGRNL